MEKVIPFDPVKRKVSKDICPKCSGELDTGWECNDCGFDAIKLATGASVTKWRVSNGP
jgi:hypothetical protein